jgi:hypothetical protein
MDWSAEARRLVAEIAAQHPRATVGELRKALREGYPWGPRSHWPYKAWRTACRREEQRRAKERGELPVSEDLGPLFGGER